MCVQTHLRDTFASPPVNVSQWGVVQGGGVRAGCEELVEGNALVFFAPGLRQAVTVDLDLRNARYLCVCVCVCVCEYPCVCACVCNWWWW